MHPPKAFDELPKIKDAPPKSVWRAPQNFCFVSERDLNYVTQHGVWRQRRQKLFFCPRAGLELRDTTRLEAAFWKCADFQKPKKRSTSKNRHIMEPQKAFDEQESP